ncbi:hypothetical protein LCGC14_3079090 [marine sediment metagenome]|uniref:Uncharacterized protein n=1 Tax=marine sediment metagenome TaxID=412755 RepID=A0A0F8Z4L1_9ZZZZ
MPSWPRSTLPKRNGEFAIAPSLQHLSQSGKLTTRSTTQVGRSWTETYLVDVRDNDDRTLMATVRNYLRNGTIFTIGHRDHLTPKGTYGGSPLVAGASQTGATINLDAASATITNWARAGDLVTFAGITLVYEVTADTNSDGGGLVALPIDPPIFAGSSPADDAALTTTAVVVTARVVAAQFPETDASNHGLLKVTFAESP